MPNTTTPDSAYWTAVDAWEETGFIGEPCDVVRGLTTSRSLTISLVMGGGPVFGETDAERGAYLARLADRVERRFVNRYLGIHDHYAASDVVEFICAENIGEPFRGRDIN